MKNATVIVASVALFVAAAALVVGPNASHTFPIFGVAMFVLCAVCTLTVRAR